MKCSCHQQLQTMLFCTAGRWAVGTFWLHGHVHLTTARTLELLQRSFPKFRYIIGTVLPWLCDVISRSWGLSGVMMRYHNWHHEKNFHDFQNRVFVYRTPKVIKSWFFFCKFSTFRTKWRIFNISGKSNRQFFHEPTTEVFSWCDFVIVLD